MQNIKVSACIITYNHEDFLAECIESAINQKVNFDYEIIIGEDKSTDSTREICMKYANLYPNLIKYHPREHNLGMIGNWMATINECTGKYIAICEGDDYWTDPFKLQKQVDFLEDNPEYNICGHSVACSEYDFFLEKKLLLKQDTIFSLKEVVQTNPIHTSSFCFRNNIDFNDTNLYKSIKDMEIGDYPLLVLFAQSNGVFAFKETMSVYRIDNQQSEWTGKLNLEAQKKKFERTVNAMIVSPFYNKVTKKYLKAKLKKKKIHFLKRVLLKIKNTLKVLFRN